MEHRPVVRQHTRLIIPRQAIRRKPSGHPENPAGPEVDEDTGMFQASPERSDGPGKNGEPSPGNVTIDHRPAGRAAGGSAVLLLAR